MMRSKTAVGLVIAFLTILISSMTLFFFVFQSSSPGDIPKGKVAIYVMLNEGEGVEDFLIKYGLESGKRLDDSGIVQILITEGQEDELVQEISDLPEVKHAIVEDESFYVRPH